MVGAVTVIGHASALATTTTVALEREHTFVAAAAAQAMVVSQLPVSLLEASLFTCIVYFMIGFYRSYSHFMVFWAVVASSNLCLSALFRWEQNS